MKLSGNDYPYEWIGRPQPLTKLLESCAQYRTRDYTIVTTNGCFDLLHNGHLHFLENASKLGDVLVVALNSDYSVRLLKGSYRPVIGETDRAAMMRSIRYVDHVVVFDQLLPTDVLALIKPDVHCKASDYSANELPEAAVVERNGGRIEILPLHKGYSTSLLIDGIVRSHTRPITDQDASLHEEVDLVSSYLLASSNLLRKMNYHLNSGISGMAAVLGEVLEKGGKILLCGNGGSAAIAEHFAAELVGLFEGNSTPSFAVALNSSSPIITAIANDFGFEEVFARQIDGIGVSGDALIVISTSGTSGNLLQAIETAKALDIVTIAMTGGNESPMVQLADISLKVPSTITSHIQQAHFAIMHAVCTLLKTGPYSRERL